MAFYKMDTPSQSMYSLNPPGHTDWDSRPPSRDTYEKPYNNQEPTRSYQALTALPNSPGQSPLPSPGFPPSPGPWSPGFPPGPGPSSLHQQSTQYAPAPSKPAGPGPPPDGGTTAWLQVLGGYFLFFNTWGLINAFGVFETYYSDVLLHGLSPSSIAWIGTLTSFLLCASPISWGPIFDGLDNPRLLVIFGSFCVVFGMMMTSLCSEYWQLMLAQGIVVGVGGGSLFITATSILPSYFSKKRALVMGLSASGSSLGGIIYPLVFRNLQPKVGYGWAVRTMAFIALLTLIIPCVVVKPRMKPPGRRKIFDTTILKEIPYEVFNLATFFGFVGQYIPYFFIEQFAGMHGIDMAFYMLTFLNVGSIPGRILPSLLADKFFHPLNVLAVCTGGATILAFCWIAIKDSTSGLIVWCLLYGFCSGAFVSLQGAAVASMATDLRTIGTRFGINMFAGAIGILIGSPVGGAIFPRSWPGAQVFCGVMLACSTVCIVATHFVYERSRTTGRSKLDG
ncbi:hypothetical protein LTR62_001239 [Meristemomyces frigidus]|uniref:Major facilitator superfamily (MFS) profile domain-containing protein n=1 Tax=Meristemomyces frigidus TaxID=1508187 RepID=A0AAN7TM67_9PEZI|nr:hypothetical protein LTR62_001239 [Meristemomyces frigidus]